MIDDLKLWAAERGVDRVTIPFVPTARNRPALEFLGSLCEIPSDAKEPFECGLSASGSSSEWRPADVPVAAVRPVALSASTVAVGDEAEMLVRIAGQFQSAEAVLGAMRNQMRRRPIDASPFVAPQSGIEAALARIWSQCLAVEPIGAKDNFFDFGGQSLIATRILTRVRSEFGVEMSLTNFFERPIVAEMAAYISNATSAVSSDTPATVTGHK